jgi:hypothetical protein
MPILNAEEERVNSQLNVNQFQGASRSTHRELEAPRTLVIPSTLRQVLSPNVMTRNSANSFTSYVFDYSDYEDDEESDDDDDDDDDDDEEVGHGKFDRYRQNLAFGIESKVTSLHINQNSTTDNNNPINIVLNTRNLIVQSEFTRTFSRFVDLQSAYTTTMLIHHLNRKVVNYCVESGYFNNALQSFLIYICTALNETSDGGNLTGENNTSNSAELSSIKSSSSAGKMRSLERYKPHFDIDANESDSDIEEHHSKHIRLKNGRLISKGRLACPYFRYDPMVFIQKRSCSTVGYTTISRLKYTILLRFIQAHLSNHS